MKVKTFYQTLIASAVAVIFTSACSDGTGFNLFEPANEAPGAALGAANPSIGTPTTGIDVTDVTDVNVTTNADLIHAQAIDGYIVGGTVFCDGVLSGVTQAAGRLTCPVGTQIIDVRGGVDVGFDETAVTGDTLFVGQLSAPAHLDYVTPLSSVAVEMASDEEGFDASKWTDSVRELGVTLGQPALDLSLDATTDIELIRLNAQINQVVAEFAQTHDEYELVMDNLAEVISNNAEVGAITDLDEGVSDTMNAVNELLAQNRPELVLSESELMTSSLAVQTTNTAIAGSVAPDVVAATASNNLLEQAVVTINRSDASIGIASYYWGWGVNISLDDFEYPVFSSGKYNTVVSSQLRGIRYENRVLQFTEDFNNARVSMAFEIKSMDEGDQRSVSFATHDVTLSAEKNNASSLVLTMPEGAIFDVYGTRANGTETITEILVEEADTFSSAGDHISVTFDEINNELIKLGYTDILATAGNYQMTLVLSGLPINERSGSTVQAAKFYTVGSGKTQLTGAGFQGYITYAP